MLSNKRTKHSIAWKSTKSLKCISVFDADESTNIDVRGSASKRIKIDDERLPTSSTSKNNEVDCERLSIDSLNANGLGSDELNTRYVEASEVGHRKMPLRTKYPIHSFASLKSEGSKLAEKGDLMEALSLWRKALSIKPDDYEVYEMQAQVLMMLDNDFSAAQSAEKAVALNKLWWVSWQTLGRAQLNLHDPTLASKSFSHALHLNPSCSDLIEDLNFAKVALKNLKELEAETVRIVLETRCSKPKRPSPCG